MTLSSICKAVHRYSAHWKVSVDLQPTTRVTINAATPQEAHYKLCNVAHQLNKRGRHSKQDLQQSSKLPYHIAIMGRTLLLSAVVLLGLTATVSAQRGRDSTSSDAAAAAAGGYQDYFSTAPTTYSTGKYMLAYDKGQSFKQKQFITCPDTYTYWKPVTAIKVCQDDQGFITGIQYFNYFPGKHYDPVTVCMISGPVTCRTFETPIDEKTLWPSTITNVKVAKIEHNDDIKVVYMSFGFSNGQGLEVGTLNPTYPELKQYQWYQFHKPGKICGLNGFYMYGFVCNKNTGYLSIVKPCYSCDMKPRFKPRKSTYIKPYVPEPINYSN